MAKVKARGGKATAKTKDLTNKAKTKKFGRKFKD
jgi:hypothetical protein